MEARSLVQHGPATLMVSLPAKWLKKNNLGKGDEINVEEKGEELILKSHSKKIKKQIEIKLNSSTGSTIRNILSNCYRLGYDSIYLKSVSLPAISIIEETIKNKLIGYEIIKKTEDSCVVENITEPTENQFDNIFSKIILNIEELYFLFESILDGKKLEIGSTERQIQSFDNFCRRVIAKSTDTNSQLKWEFHSNLGHAQREVYLGLSLCLESKIKSETIAKLVKESNKAFALLMRAYEKRNIEVLEELHDLQKQVVAKKGEEYFKKAKPEERIILYHLISSIRNFYLASSPLMGLILLESK